MPTCQPVSAFIAPRDLPQLTNSLGAHLSAKLQLFSSDERTLTDELCDMLHIWAALTERLQQGTRTRNRIALRLQKQTVAQEAKTGADLELVVSTPRGAKRALLQAKILESTQQLRQNSRAQLAKLRRQLSAAADDAGSTLTFLLLYVPHSLLDGQCWAFPTWEQGMIPCKRGFRSSAYGATIVALSDLWSRRRCWMSRPSFKHVGDFASPLPHITLTRLLLELILCDRGAYGVAGAENAKYSTPSYRTLTADLAAAEGSEWDTIEGELRSLLVMPGEFGLEL